MQSFVKFVAALALVGGATPAIAQVEPYQDYTVSEGLSRVTTVKVKANMMDYYLEGLRKTWVPSAEASKKLGHIESYAIYISELPDSGDFNLMLAVRFANSSMLAPDKGRYDAFMREWGEANEDANAKITSNVYPDIREITGEYLVRELTLKPE